jgi:hypothetical protein
VEPQLSTRTLSVGSNHSWEQLRTGFEEIKHTNILSKAKTCKIIWLSLSLAFAFLVGVTCDFSLKSTRRAHSTIRPELDIFGTGAVLPNARWMSHPVPVVLSSKYKDGHYSGDDLVDRVVLSLQVRSLHMN